VPGVAALGQRAGRDHRQDVAERGHRRRPDAALVLCNFNGQKEHVKDGFARLDNSGKASRIPPPDAAAAARQPCLAAGGGQGWVTDVRLHRVMARADKGGIAVELRGGQ